MSNVLIIGAQREVFTQEYNSLSHVLSGGILVSRKKAKGDILTKEVGLLRAQAAQLDTDNVPQLVELINASQPDLVIHIELPYQDSCKEKALTAIFGSGFDLGVTNMVTVFTTNFNPEINFQENTQIGRYWENENWIEVEPHEIYQDLASPCVGIKGSYLIYHGELDSLTNDYPSLTHTRLWMTFWKEYLSRMKVVHSMGMARIDLSIRKRSSIIPLQFLRKNLPEPGGLGEDYTKETLVEGRFSGLKDEWEKSYSIRKGYIHQIAFEETRTQEDSYTTTTPAMIGTEMLLSREWYEDAVNNVEEISANFFSQYLATYRFSRQEEVYRNLEVN
ncbi:MAG: saccharopine dehydrogenase C-terminal domain-containing protein [Bacteroidota bacterium]